MIKKCPECQFEPSQFGTYKYTPHAPGCSRANPTEGEPIFTKKELKRFAIAFPAGLIWVAFSSYIINLLTNQLCQ